MKGLSSETTNIHIWYNCNVQERSKWIPSPSCSVFLILDTLPVSWSLRAAGQPQRNKGWPTAFFPYCQCNRIIFIPLLQPALRWWMALLWACLWVCAKWHTIIFILQLLQKMELNRSLTIWMNLLHITFLSPLQKKADKSRQKWLGETGKTAHSGYPTFCIQIILILSNTSELSFICWWSTTSQL